MNTNPFRTGHWFSGIGLFRHVFENRSRVPQYEERIVVVKARSLAAAEREILKEFKNYGDSRNGVTYLGEYDIQDIFSTGGKVTEVGYLMRVSDMPPRQYIKTLWEDLRPADCRAVGWKHAWHNQDDKSVSCYNCRKTAKGSRSLWKSWGRPGPYSKAKKK